MDRTSMDKIWTLGKTLAEKRKSLNLTLRGVSEAVKNKNGNPVSPQYLYDIEQDRRNPSADILRQISQVLGLDEDYLRAVNGVVPESVVEYLKLHPEQAVNVKKAFEEALDEGSLPWDMNDKIRVAH